MPESQKEVSQLPVIGVAVLLAGAIALLFYFNSQKPTSTPTTSPRESKLESKAEENEIGEDEMMEEEMVHGIVLTVDGNDYYFEGPADGKQGEKDIPGHYWKKTGEDILSGRHYNTGPSGAAKFWSSDAEDGALLYQVDAVIDEWTADKAETYAEDGFVHYHELISVETGELHPDKVVWLKHTAVVSFSLDGDVVGNFGHQVEPGVDFEFPPNGRNPYNPEI